MKIPPGYMSRQAVLEHIQQVRQVDAREAGRLLAETMSQGWVRVDRSAEERLIAANPKNSRFLGVRDLKKYHGPDIFAQFPPARSKSGGRKPSKHRDRVIEAAVAWIDDEGAVEQLEIKEWMLQWHVDHGIPEPADSTLRDWVRVALEQHTKRRKAMK